MVIGSFLNVVIFRLPMGQSIATPPSHCGHCGKRLGALDLVPVLSYIALRGRCRYCSARISSRYPLVEMLTGFLFFTGIYFFGTDWKILFYFVYVSLLLAISMIDLDHQIIPDELIITGFVVAVAEKVAYAFLLGMNANMKDSLLGMLAGGGLFLLLAIFSN